MFSCGDDMVNGYLRSPAFCPYAVDMKRRGEGSHTYCLYKSIYKGFPFSDYQKMNTARDSIG